MVILPVHPRTRARLKEHDITPASHLHLVYRVGYLKMEYLPLYNTEQARRHEVRSRVSGWTQINGRNAISWDEKFALDVRYVDSQSLWLDIKIIWLTIPKVIKRDGISASGGVAMSKFTGNGS